MAALLCALHPIFPLSSSDNRYHLQAFRHLYVLASEPRILVTQDIDTGQACCVDVVVTASSDPHHMRVSSPCIVPEWSSIDKARSYLCARASIPVCLGPIPMHLFPFLYSHSHDYITIRLRYAAPGTGASDWNYPMRQLGKYAYICILLVALCMACRKALSHSGIIYVKKRNSMLICDLGTEVRVCVCVCG